MNSNVAALPARQAVVAPASTGSALIPASMDQAVRLAELMARAKAVPQHLQGSPGDCLMVVEQAMRWNMSPFAVAQCACSVKGKLMFEGKLVAAAIENSGALDGYLDYQFEGDGDTRKIVVTGTRRGEQSPRSVEVFLKDARTDNIWWKKTPDQMLVYHGARVWGRRWLPSVMLGVYSPEEFSRGEIPDDGRTIEGTAEPAQTVPAPAEETAEPKKHTVRDWLAALKVDLAAAMTANAVDVILARPDVEKAQDTLKGTALEDLRAMVQEALERTASGVSMPATGDDDGFPTDVMPG